MQASEVILSTEHTTLFPSHLGCGIPAFDPADHKSKRHQASKPNNLSTLQLHRQASRQSPGPKPTASEQTDIDPSTDVPWLSAPEVRLHSTNTGIQGVLSHIPLDRSSYILEPRNDSSCFSHKPPQTSLSRIFWFFLLSTHTSSYTSSSSPLGTFPLLHFIYLNLPPSPPPPHPTPAMSQLDNDRIAPAATNVINPSVGGTYPDSKGNMHLTRSRADSIDKAYMDHNEELEKVPEDRDINTKADHFGTNTVYSSEETSLVKKLDWHIMPIVFCMYFMNKLDQNAIANARLDSFEKDLGLTGNQFNVLVSVLYVSSSSAPASATLVTTLTCQAGYTLIQIPSNMLMSTKKVRPSLWMAGWMV